MVTGWSATMISPTDFNDIAANGARDYGAYFGTPTYDDHVLFELLIVGILQVGLGWQVAGYEEPEWERLMATPKVMHNGRKLRAIITDARGIMMIQREFGHFSDYLWQFVDATPLLMPAPDDELPHQSPLGTRVAKDLHRRGFTFVGPVVTHMFLLAAGIIKVN